MPSSASTRLGLNLQASGEGSNTWGVLLNAQALQLVDDAVAGRSAFTLSGTKTLTSGNFAANEARSAFLDITSGTGGTVTIPNREKPYLVRNACSGDVIFTTGGATNATVKPGSFAVIVTDGTSVYVIGGASMGGARVQDIGAPTANTDAATKKYVDDTAFATALGSLPGLPGNAFKSLRVKGDETTVEWGYPGLNGRRAIAGADSVAVADGSKLLACSGTFTLGFTAAATLGNTFAAFIQNAGTGNVTLDPNGAELIDGLTSFIMYPGEIRLVICTGTAFVSIVLNPFYNAWIATDTGFTWPPGYQAYAGLGWGGGGGGSGSDGSATGGGGGGALPYLIPASSVTPGATATITIAAGGAGSGGADGSAGGNSSVGAIVTFYGGAGGAYASAGGGGGGALGAGSGANGGSPSTSNTANHGLGGAAGASGGGSGRDAAWGGASGGGPLGSRPGGKSVYGGGGGGPSAAGGTSVFGGAGGAGTGVAGSAPGGGGGANASGTGGAGARGEVRMWGII